MLKIIIIVSVVISFATLVIHVMLIDEQFQSNDNFIVRAISGLSMFLFSLIPIMNIMLLVGGIQRLIKLKVNEK